MPAQQIKRKLPKHLKRAVKLGLMTAQDAEDWRLTLAMQSHQHLIYLPEHLHQPAENLWLLEMPCREMRQ